MKHKIKNIKSKLFVLIPVILLIGIFIPGCGIDETINNSPNATDQSKIMNEQGMKRLLIGLQVAVADFYSGDRSRISSIWTWQMCAPKGLGRPQPNAWNSYSMTQDGPTDDMWKIAYRGVKIANDIITLTPQVTFPLNQTENRNTLIGIAKTYKALLFGELAAFYGSIPIEVNSMNPAPFVTQREVYTKVQQLLDEALANFASTTAINQDLNFAGDGAKWIEAAHSLKARYHLHMKEYTEALAEAKLGIKASSGNLFGIYTDNAGEYSPWGHWTKTEVGEPIRGEMTFVNLLKSEDPDASTHKDSRLSQYFNAGGANFWGFAAHAETTADTNETNAAVTVTMNKYGNYADYFPLISYEETILISAESKAQNNDVAGAVSDVNIIRSAAGLSNFAGTDKTLTITEVLKQKNLQLFLEGQVYHDMRRTGTMPDPKPGVNLRWIYSESELNANPNVPANDDQLCKWLLAPAYGGI
ncbi:MAG: RagB/SusD family nutrient uptake outer membrane protein [Bacteroidota bacterium]